MEPKELETTKMLLMMLAIARKVGMTPEELNKEMENLKANTEFLLDMVKAKIK